MQRMSAEVQSSAGWQRIVLILVDTKYLKGAARVATHWICSSIGTLSGIRMLYALSVR
jgi:hypothetical protein